jgi:ribokinase
MDSELEQPIWQGIYEAVVVDTTAAGDTFTGYFIAEIAGGKAADYALRLASAAAAIAVSRPGAAVSIPARAEAEGLVYKLYGAQ